MDFADVSDFAVPDHFGALASAFVRIALVPHLCGDFAFLGSLLQRSTFPDGMGQRLLHIDMLAMLHGEDGGRSMHMIGDTNDYRVDVAALLLDHFAEIFEPRNVGVLL